jgi:hypothetical protein
VVSRALTQRLLGRIDDAVEKTADEIRQETKHAEDVKEASGTFWMYVCILVLILIMVLEIVMGTS